MDDLLSPSHGFEKLGILALLVIDHWFLEPLSKVDAVHAILGAEHFPVVEDLAPLGTLGVDQFTKFQKVFLTSQVVKPKYNLKIVSPTLRPPESPVVKRELGEHF